MSLSYTPTTWSFSTGRPAWSPTRSVPTPWRSSSSPTSSFWNFARSTTGSTIASKLPIGSSAPRSAGAWLPVRWRLHRDAVRQIRELEIEATSLFERVDNSLKLIGDHYLARVFEVAGGAVSPARLAAKHPPQARDRRRRLRPVGPAGGRHRMEALEITVVVLIALEIALAIFRH